MALNIIIGDPFIAQVSINDDTANTLLDISSGYSVEFLLKQSLTNGKTLSGVNYNVSSNNIITIQIADTDTATYQSGLGALYMKVNNSDNSVILRHRENVNFIKEEI